MILFPLNPYLWTYFHLITGHDRSIWANQFPIPVRPLSITTPVLVLVVKTSVRIAIMVQISPKFSALASSVVCPVERMGIVGLISSTTSPIDRFKGTDRDLITLWSY